MPRTLTAASLNDLGTLRHLADTGKIEANCRLSWPRQYAVTPLCVTTDAACCRLLLQYRANVHANVGRNDADAEPFLLVHHLSAFCHADVLRLVLNAGAASDLNALGERLSCLHQSIALGSIYALGLQVAVSPTSCLWKSEAKRWRQSVDVLLSARADAWTLGQWGPQMSPAPASALVITTWDRMQSLYGSGECIAVLERLLTLMKHQRQRFESHIRLLGYVICAPKLQSVFAEDKEALLRTLKAVKRVGWIEMIREVLSL